MKKSNFKSLSCIMAFMVILGVLIRITSAETGNQSGIVIKKDGGGVLTDNLCLKPGDLVVEWERLSGITNYHESVNRKIRTVFDWSLMVREESSRGPVMLTIIRDGQRKTCQVGLSEWAYSVRPYMLESTVKDYETANDYVIKNQLDKGADQFESLATHMLENESWSLACWFYMSSGEIYERSRNFGQACEVYKLALSLAEKFKSKTGQALLWQALANVYTRQSNFDKGDKAYHEAEKIVEELWGNESLNFSYIRNKRGIIAYYQGNLTKADEFWKHALRVRQSLSPHSLEVAESLKNLGNVMWQKGDLPGAESNYKEALVLSEKLAPRSIHVAGNLGNLGNIAKQKGDPALAESYYKRALLLFEKIAPHSLKVASCLGNLGALVLDSGDLSKAEEYFNKALAIKEKLAPDSMQTAASLGSLGNVARLRGDLSLAELYYKKSLEISKKLAPHSLSVAGACGNLGVVLWQRGDHSGALELYNEALIIGQTLAPGSLEVARSLEYLGNLALDRGDHLLAEQFHKQALEIREKKAPGSLDSATSFFNLGMIAIYKRDMKNASIFHQKALNIRENHAPHSLSVASSYNVLGSLALLQGDTSGAEQNFRQALIIREKLAPGSEKEAESLHKLGTMYYEQQNYSGTLEYYQRAVNSLEKQKGVWGGGKEGIELFSVEFTDYYRDLVNILIKEKQIERAFHVLEQYRARSFLIMLAERDLVFSVDASEELLREQKKADIAYQKIQDQLTRINPLKDSDKVDDLLKQAEILRVMQEEISMRIRSSSPHLANLQYPTPLDLSSAKTIFPSGTLFLSYSVGRDSTQLITLFNGDLSAYSIPIEREELKKSIQFFTSLASVPESPSSIIKKTGHELYKLLLHPIKEDMDKAEGLIICPDGPLHFLPFSALSVDKERYLIEIKPLSYILSATVYGESLKDFQSDSDDTLALAAFGDPLYSEQSNPGEFNLSPLPSTRKEIESISNLFNEKVKIFLGEMAREEEVKKLSCNLGYLHFACHGLLDNKFPLNSGLALTSPNKSGQGTEDGILQVWEIFESLRLNADLVTLSACQTGLGKEMGGEGLIGLSRAFLYAGAHSVLSTLWPVADVSTAEFMKRFYTYRKEGKAKAEALRLSKIEFINNTNYREKQGNDEELNVSHPFFWAGFILNGDWK